MGAMATGAAPLARPTQTTAGSDAVSSAFLARVRGGGVSGADHAARQRWRARPPLRWARGARPLTRAVATDSPSSSGGEKTAKTASATGSGSSGGSAIVVPSFHPTTSSGTPEDVVLDRLADDALGETHALCKRWVVFSDLHVNRKTAPVAMQVLRAVHETALERDAGIIFLGDFWHARGAIPVEPLVDALFEISNWRVPAVMIPGNHDQVTAGGETHALTPLQAANPTFVRVLSRPTLWRDALWLPYRRDRECLRRAVDEAKASYEYDLEPKKNGSLRAIMCHADVLGASMNETFQARDGIDPGVFGVAESFGEKETSASRDGDAATRLPKTIPTYTGHYHKPHTVPGTRITYVGSPYQVSRAEAGQQKALVVLDAEKGWLGCEETFAREEMSSEVSSTRIATESESETDTSRRFGGDAAVTDLPARALVPLDLGPRHFSVRGEDGAIPEEARAGDLVRWMLPLSSEVSLARGAEGKKKKGAPESAADAASRAIASARARGVEVEITYEAVSTAPRIPQAEEMGPAGLYDAYASAVGMPSEVADFGREVLADVAAAAARRADADGTSLSSLQMRGSRAFGGSPIHVSLHSVEVEGFGAFAERAVYPLRGRGVCAVVGDNRDDRCSDSNGAGKTTLVMAPMWALTGRSDARVEDGSSKTLTKTDVVSDDAKTARVSLRGEVDGVPFVVERRVSRTRVLSLTYSVGGEDMTLADSRLTQAAMDRDLGAQVLARVVFHGQHTVGSLLDANDAALKAALGELVEADTWAAAKEASKKKVAEQRKKLASARADVDARQAFLRRAEERLITATEARDAWEDDVRQRKAVLEKSVAAADEAARAAARRCVSARDRLRAVSAAWDAEERDAAAAAAEAERRMWDESGVSAFADESASNDDDAPVVRDENNSENSERAFADRAATLERNAERLRAIAADARGAEAAANAVAAKAHEAVGAFRGLSGFSRPKQTLSSSSFRVCVDASHSDAQPTEPTEQTEPTGASPPPSLGTCDRCLQPIDPAAHKNAAARLVAEAEAARRAHVAAAAASRAADAEAARATALVRAHAADAAAAREAARRASEAVAREARDAAERLASVRARRVNPVVFASALARLDAVCGAHAPAVPGSPSGSEEATGSFGNTAPAVRLPASKPFDALEPDGGKSAVASAEDAAAEAERLLRFADERVADLRDQQFGSTTNPRSAEVETLKEQVDAESASLDERKRQADSAEEELNVFRKADVAFGSRGIQSYLFEGALAELSARVATYMETLTGGALTLKLAPANAEIGTSSSRGAAKKSPSTKKKKGSSSRTPSTSRSEGNEVRSDDSDTDNAFGSSSDFESSADDSRLGVASEKIEKIVRARGLDGVLLRRSLRQLSGGERRRAALALALAHADLASSRGGVHCDLLVLDEVLQHLDAEGIARVAAALRAMPKKTILLTSQADSATSHLFDTVDRVFKRGGSAGVATASGASLGLGEENPEDEDEARFAEREETA